MQFLQKFKKTYKTNLFIVIILTALISFVGCYGNDISDINDDSQSTQEEADATDSFAIPTDSSLIDDENIVIPGPSAVIEYIDEQPLSGETITMARTRSLSAYGTKLIKAKDYELMQIFNNRGILWKPMAETFEIKVDGCSCFNEDFQVGTIYNIKSNNDLENMKKQVEYVVDFLYQLHLDANGHPNLYFNSVSLCPKRKTGHTLLLQGQTLYIGVKYIFGMIFPINSFDLRDSWSKGEHLKKYLPQLVDVWDYIDPVGPKRILLKEKIRSSAEFVSSLLSEILEEMYGPVAKEDMRDLIEFYTLSDLEDKDGNIVMEKYLNRLDDMDIYEVHKLAWYWKRFLDNNKNWEGMADAATATYVASISNAYNINLNQKGMVLVGNFHNILVDVSVFLPQNRFFLKYVTIEKIDQNINVQQHGLVCVYTIDNVEVNLSVTVDLGVETAGLEYSMSRL